MENNKSLPQFKYNPNAYELDIFERFNGTCECCGKSGDIFYQGLYCAEDVDYVCPDCIASGEAAKKFDGEFPCGYNRIDNPDAIDELAHRTPNFTSWQDQEWKDCCGDFCAYLGPVGTKELEELGIADELFEEDGSFEGWKDARADLVKNSWFTGHLFQCLHCGKYQLIVEVD